jgi:divalent metal cation (Fe/Co/Zn/Cd) transporter
MWRSLAVDSSALAHAGLALMIQASAALIGREAGVPLAWAATLGGCAAVGFYWVREWRHALGKSGASSVTLSPLTWHRKSQLDLAGPVVACAAMSSIVWGLT